MHARWLMPTAVLFAGASLGTTAEAKVMSKFRVVEQGALSGDTLKFALCWDHPGGAASGGAKLYLHARTLRPSEAAGNGSFCVGQVELPSEAPITPINVKLSAVQEHFKKQGVTVGPGSTMYVAAVFDYQSHMWGTNGNSEGNIALQIPNATQNSRLRSGLRPGRPLLRPAAWMLPFARRGPFSRR